MEKKTLLIDKKAFCDWYFDNKICKEFFDRHDILESLKNKSVFKITLLLDQLLRLHDAELGINWLVIENYIEQHIDEKKEQRETNKHWQSYGVYAIALQLKNPEWGIDVQWQEAIDLYEKFYSSKWNDVNQSEIECINKFMADFNNN